MWDTTKTLKIIVKTKYKTHDLFTLTDSIIIII